MALATATTTFARATAVAPAVSVAPSAGVPDNCEEVLLLNRSGNVALFQIGAPGAIVDDATSGKIPAGGSLVLAVGTLTQGRLSGVMDEAETAGSGFVFGYAALDANPFVDIIYKCVVR